METLRLPVVENRYYQYAFWHAMDNGCNRAVKSWHRRAGKDITDFQYMVRAAAQRPGTYYYYFPTLEDAKGALWGNITEFWHRGEVVAAGNMMDILCPKRLRISTNQSEHLIRIRAKGGESIIKLGGTDNLKVIGLNGYGYVFSEWQGQKKEAFGLISPILRENGGWALFNGTMRGRSNHLYQDIQTNRDNNNCFTQWLRPEDTKQYFWINAEEGINVNPELEGRIHPDTLRPYDNIQDTINSGEISFYLARQEFLNEVVSNVGGAYYSYELRRADVDGRLKGFHISTDLVYTFWDLGGVGQDSDKTCIWFVQMDHCNGTAKIINYYENTGYKRGHYLDYLGKTGYMYGGHYLPHDAKKRNEFTGESMADTARNEFGIEMRFIPKTNSIINDIEITRRDFSNYWFNGDLCEEAIEYIGNYHESPVTGKPCHSNNCRQCGGASHPADGLRQMAMARHLKLVEPYLRPERNVRKRSSDFVDDDWMVI